MQEACTHRSHAFRDQEGVLAQDGDNRGHQEGSTLLKSIELAVLQWVIIVSNVQLALQDYLSSQCKFG